MKRNLKSVNVVFFGTDYVTSYSFNCFIRFSLVQWIEIFFTGKAGYSDREI